MSQHVRRTPQARADLSQIAARIARDDVSSALRFLDAAEETFATLLRSPELGIVGEFRSPRLTGIRRWRIDGFENYLEFYRVLGREIEVIRVIHGARDIEGLFGSR